MVFFSSSRPFSSTQNQTRFEIQAFSREFFSLQRRYLTSQPSRLASMRVATAARTARPTASCPPALRQKSPNSVRRPAPLMHTAHTLHSHRFICLLAQWRAFGDYTMLTNLNRNLPSAHCSNPLPERTPSSTWMTRRTTTLADPASARKRRRFMTRRQDIVSH